MKLILIGCEYSGTTTLALAIHEWAEKTMGVGFRIIHDHWKIPHTSGHLPNDTAHLLTEEEQRHVLTLSPKLKEMTQRHSIYYHMPREPDEENSVLIGYHVEDGIYGPLYFEYGRPTDPEDRSIQGRVIEHSMLKVAPETVLVLLKTSPDVIASRMIENPHTNGVLRKEDIEYVLGRFEDEFRRSLIKKRITLDTSTATVEDTLAEFDVKIQPYLTRADRLRMLLHGSRGDVG